MHIVMLSKALVVGEYQRKCELIAQCLCEVNPSARLTVLVPQSWRTGDTEQTVEYTHTDGYTLRAIPIALNGNFHLHFYPTLARELARLKPDLVHIDEEPYNLATYLAMRAANRVGAKTIFFAWQNILRRYPAPFAQMERAVLQRADAAIVGSHEAAAVLRAKGCSKHIEVIPQFGVDENRFAFAPRKLSADDFVVGYAGRLVREKGVDVLLRAVSNVPRARVRILGDGDQRSALQTLTRDLNIAERVEFLPPMASTEMSNFYTSIDVLVLPSRTQPNWKEQFGRVLIEAMSCGVPVIGSTCGEIPAVIGDAGLTFAEDDADALAHHIRQIMSDSALYADLAQRGRARVLARFTMSRVAQQTVALYQSIHFLQKSVR